MSLNLDKKGLKSIIRDFDLFFIDIWGVIHNGIKLFKNSIVVFAKKEKFKNLIVYDAINKILNKNKILAPILYKENYKKGYI